LVVCGSEYPESDDFLILRSASLLEKRRDLGPERLPGLPFPFGEFLEVALLSDADKVAVNGFPCSWSILQMWVKSVERYMDYAAWLQTTEIQDIEADRTRRTIG
jgi:hypothetical protein